MRFQVSLYVPRGKTGNIEMTYCRNRHGINSLRSNLKCYDDFCKSFGNDLRCRVRLMARDIVAPSYSGSMTHGLTLD